MFVRFVSGPLRRRHENGVAGDVVAGDEIDFVVVEIQSVQHFLE
jgi:hypothetical protein